MNTNLMLATSQNFGNIKCDFWSDNDNNDFWMTREQIGTALEYGNAKRAISDIHNRHKERMDKYSRVTQIAYPSGGIQEVYIYSARGVFEICRWSRQTKADEFMDWVWDIVDGLRTGKYKLTQNNSVIPYDKMIADLDAKVAELFQQQNHIQDVTELNTDSIMDLAYKFDDLQSEMHERTEVYDRLINAKGCLSMNQVAKSIGLGRNTMMKILRSQNILFLDGKDNIPYERYVKSGYFIVTNKTDTNGEIHAGTKATAKGVKFILDTLGELCKVS